MANQEGTVRSAGYRRWHAFWCAVAGLILLCCINTTLTGRALINGGISSGMRGSRLSDASIPFSGTLSEYIRRQYVNDDKVTQEDVAEAVDAMHIPDFLAGKLSNYGVLLRSGMPGPVHVTGDEIVTLLEDSEDALYDKCLLIIEDSDKADLRSAAETPLGILNGISDFLYGSRFGRTLARLRMSAWRLVLDILLMMLLVMRWAIVRENSGKDRAGAMRGMGWVIIVPSVLLLLLMTAGGISGLLAKDGVIGLHTLTKALRAPLWAPVIFELACGIFMTSFAKYLRSGAREKALAEKAARRQAQAQHRRSNASAAKGAAAPAAPVRRFCVFCGKELRPNAAFCIYCGKKQSAPEASAAPAAPAAPATASEAPSPASAPEAPAPAPTVPAAEQPAPADETAAHEET